VSLAGRQLSHGVAAEYGTGGRLGWQSAVKYRDLEKLNISYSFSYKNSVS